MIQNVKVPYHKPLFRNHPVDKTHRLAIMLFQVFLEVSTAFTIWQFNIAMEHHHFQWKNPLSTAIFNSYVKLLEGSHPHQIPLNHNFPLVFPWFSLGWYLSPYFVAGYLSPSMGLKFSDVPNGLAAITKVDFFWINIRWDDGMINFQNGHPWCTDMNLFIVVYWCIL